jgi:hypothetical protein
VQACLRCSRILALQDDDGGSKRLVEDGVADVRVAATMWSDGDGRRGGVSKGNGDVVLHGAPCLFSRPAEAVKHSGGASPLGAMETCASPPCGCEPRESCRVAGLKGTTLSGAEWLRASRCLGAPLVLKVTFCASPCDVHCDSRVQMETVWLCVVRLADDVNAVKVSCAWAKVPSAVVASGSSQMLNHWQVVAEQGGLLHEGAARKVLEVGGDAASCPACSSCHVSLVWKLGAVALRSVESPAPLLPLAMLPTRDLACAD